MPIIIDTGRCTRCGLCIEECPSSTLALVEEDGYPEPAVPERCVHCGHCMAICPVNAASAPSGQGFPQVETVDLDRSEVERALVLKRSIRAFTDRAIDEDTLRRIIDFGERAPSSHNFRTRRYVALTSREKIEEAESAVVRSLRPVRRILNPVVLGAVSLLSRPWRDELRSLRAALDNVIPSHRAGGTPISRGAPCMVCVAAAKRNTQARDDCVVALHYMMLYAQSIGISSCVSGYAQHAHKKLERLIGLPRTHAVYAVGIFGHPRNHYSRALYYGTPEVAIH